MLFLERITGEERVKQSMTVWREGSPQNKELKKGFIPDAQRLCERTGLEPGRVDAPYPLQKNKKALLLQCFSFGADYE